MMGRRSLFTLRAVSLGSANLVSGEARAQPLGHTGIEKHPHWDERSGLRGDCLGEENRLCELEHGDSVLSRNAGKIL